MGNQSTLVIDKFVGLDSDPTSSPDRAQAPQLPAGVPGYRANFARMGFTDSDISELSHHLVDELVAWVTPTRSPTGFAPNATQEPTTSSSPP